MKRKFLALLTATIILACVFSACGQADGGGGSGGDAKEAVTLDFWAYPYWNGITGAEADGKAEDFWYDCIERFKQANSDADITINFEMLPWDGGPNKVNIAIASKSNPNVLVDGPIRFLGYASRGVLEPLDDHFTADDLADYVDGAWDSGKLPSDGKHYSVPWYTDVYCVIINRAMFEEIGIADKIPSDADRSWTYEEFREVLQAFRDNDMYGLSLYAANEQDDAATWLFAFGNGATLFNSSYDEITFNSPESVESFEYLRGLVEDDLVLPAPETIKSTDITQFFKERKVAMIMSSMYLVSVIESDATAGALSGDFDLTVAMIPRSADGPKINFELSQGFAVFKSDDANKTKWAVDFAKFLGNKENSEATKAIFSVPYRKSLQNLHGDSDAVAWGMSQLKYVFDRGIWVDGYSEVRALFYPALQSIYIGQQTPQEALDSFKADADQKINK